MVDRQRLEQLRATLWRNTPLRAEELAPGELEERGWFVDVFRAREDGEIVDDPILDIADQVAWSDQALLLGLTGGTGVGKTTQIGRLARVLDEQHRITLVRVDYGQVNELSSPPDVTDFLLSVVGGFAQAAVAGGYLPAAWNQPGVGSRLLKIFKRLQVPHLDVSIAGVASLSPLDLLREDETFRARLRQHLAGRVSQVVDEVRTYAGEVAAGIKDQHGGAGVALVVDSTEKLAAPGSAQEQMQSAVRNLFVQNGGNLAFPELHAIYLVPPWLPVSDGGALRLPLCQFPAIRTERRGTGAAADEHGLALLNEIVRRRMPDIDELVDPSDLRRLASASGGVQRVLFQLLHAVARLARATPSLPVPAQLIDAAIESIREDYLAVTVEAAPWLARIQATGSLDGLPAQALAALGSYFQAMVVLQFANGTKWYAIHPLMRGRIERAQGSG